MNLTEESGIGVYVLIRWITSILILIGSSCFFIGFIKLQEKTLFSKMILILAISDFIFSLAHLWTAIFGHEIPLFTVITASNRFSLYWSASLAFLTYQILVTKKPIYNSFLYKSFFICVFVTGVFTFL